MPPEELQAIMKQIQDLKARVDRFERQERFRFYKDVELDKEIGVRIGLYEKDKLAFHGNPPVIQFSDPLGRSDIDGNSSGTNMTTGHRFNGNTGSDYYSVGDIVYALKLKGILKNQ